MSLVAVGVDGLDAVHVAPLGVDGVVDIGGVRGAGVGRDRPEGALGVDVLVAPQDHVAGDGVVAGVVPTQRDRVVGHLCGQSRGLGRPAGRRFGGCGGVGPHPAGDVAGAVGVDGLDAVHVASLGVHAGVDVGRRGGAGVGRQGDKGALGVDVLVAPQDHISGDAAVAGVVPGEGHQVVGHLRGKPGGEARRGTVQGLRGQRRSRRQGQGRDGGEQEAE